MSAALTVEDLLEDELRFHFRGFTKDTAWSLGTAIRNKLVEAEAPAAVEVTHGGQVAFYSSLTGAGPDNDDWIRRKRNVVSRFGHSSLWMKLSAQPGFHERYRLPAADFAAVGGSFPILVTGVGQVGIASISGMASDEAEHRLITACIQEIQGAR
ncbi:heme-degrading domain-containing protein [Homoserinimonas sp. A447]